VLAACLGLSWAVVQLAVSLAAVTVARLTGKSSLGGFGPGLMMISWAFASLYMGRFMDSHGRSLGIRIGFLVGVVGSVIVYVGADARSIAVFLVGLLAVGFALGTVNLARAGAADMYPPSRRARGISLVLVGAAAGAILSPIVFAPMLSSVRGGVGDLATPWLAASAILGIGFLATFAIRVDPIPIARGMTSANAAPTVQAPGRSISALLRVPRVGPALIAAVLSQGVMSSLMSITGLIMVDAGHTIGSITVVMSAHFFGMFGLVLVAGQLVDRIGRQNAIVIGLSVLTVGALSMLMGGSLIVMIPALFLIGVGWNIAFVGSTATLADATEPRERGSLLGFNDFVATNMGAVGAMTFAVVYGEAGLVPLVGVAVVLALTPIAGLIVRRPVASET